MKLAAALVAALLVAGCARPGTGSSVDPPPSGRAPSATSGSSARPVATSRPSPLIARTTPSMTAEASPSEPVSAGPSPPASPAVPAEVAVVRDLVPTEIGGVRYDVGGTTIDVREDVPGGDFCLFWCPGQLAGYARQLGVTAGPLTIVVAQADRAATRPVVGIWAIRVPAAKGRDLVDAWLRNDWYKPRAPFPIRESVTIAGKAASAVMFDWPPHQFYRHYAYAKGDVLFLVFAAVGDTPEFQPIDLLTPSDVVVDAFSKLP